MMTKLMPISAYCIQSILLRKIIHLRVRASSFLRKVLYKLYRILIVLKDSHFLYSINIVDYFHYSLALYFIVVQCFQFLLLFSHKTFADSKLILYPVLSACLLFINSFIYKKHFLVKKYLLNIFIKYIYINIQWVFFSSQIYRSSICF